METALTYALSSYPWQFFGTLTFKSERLPERVRVSMWFAYVRTVSRWFSVRWSGVVWVLRQEAGEATGRLHFHFLIAGLPQAVVTTATAMSAKRQWEKLGGGMARVRKYDPTLDGVEYVLKCLDSSSGANLYEVGKFSSRGSQVMVSNNFWSLHPKAGS